jgi:hypothetical protein
MLSDAGIVRIESGSTPLVELRFDGAKQGESRDLRPALPLVVSY